MTPSPLPAFPALLHSETQARTTHGAGGGATGAAAAAAGAAPSRLFAMDNFIDRTAAEGRFDFSEWVRAYGKYLDEQVRRSGLGGARWKCPLHWVVERAVEHACCALLWRAALK